MNRLNGCRELPRRYGMITKQRVELFGKNDVFALSVNIL